MRTPPVPAPAAGDGARQADATAGTGAEERDEEAGAAVADTPWAPAKPRLGPALVVVAIALVLVGGGIALSALFSSPAPVASPSRGRLAGQALAAEAAAPVLARIASAGEPPRDISSALVIPAGAVYRSRHPTSGLQLYNAAVTLGVDAAPSEVVSFYRSELRHLGWSGITVDATATGSGTEVLARHPSADGFYWEVGATVTPSTPSLSPALGGGTQHAPTSTLSLSVYEVNDAD